MKRVDIRAIQRAPILRAELKARYWGGRVGELVGMRYERRSLLITANQPFGEWGRSSPVRP